MMQFPKTGSMLCIMLLVSIRHDQYDLDILLQLVVIFDYNTHYTGLYMYGEQVAMSINGKYTTVRYSWMSNS